MNSSGPGEPSVFTIGRDTLPPLSELLRITAGRALPASHLWAVQLVVTELATNACEHGAGRVTVAASATRRPCSALLEVHDAGDEHPVVVRPSAASRRGRGLVLVTDLARSWGVRPAAPGKTVWAWIDCGTTTVESCAWREEPIIMDPEPC